MIAIIAAQDEEVFALRDLMSDVKKENIKGIEGFFGKIDKEEIVLIKSGVGKVAAAITSTILFDTYDIDYVINIGSAGSLKEEMPIGSIIIATKLAYHDHEVYDWPKNFNDLEHLYFPNDRLLKIAKRLATPEVFFKPMVSGDTFVYEDRHVNKLLEEFPDAFACEMEATAIANVASFFNIPFIIIRSISDVVTVKGSDMDYESFLKFASLRSAEYCKKFIEEVKNED